MQYNDKQAARISNLVEQTWLCRYPQPTIIMYDHINEFLGNTFKNDLIQNEYVIKSKFKTTANPKSNSILEFYQVIENLVRKFDLQKNYIDKDKPWAGIIAATVFVM